MLERDQDSTTPSVTANGAAATAGADRTSTWDFPRVFNKLVSRSCISLCESRSQANAVAASGASNYSQVCAASVGWGSASCIAHQNYQLKRRAGAHGGSPLDHRKVNQSSLVTLLNLAVDGHAGCDAIYQLVDQSLLLVDQENSEEADSPRQMRPLRVFQSRGSGLLEDRNAEACFREEFIVSFEW